MTNENNIDKLFRDKLYHRDFEFDPKHWEEAEKLIEAAQNRKKLRFPGKKQLAAIISALLILTGTGIFIVFKTDESRFVKNDSFVNSPLIPLTVEENINPDSKTTLAQPQQPKVKSELNEKPAQTSGYLANSEIEENNSKTASLKTNNRHSTEKTKTLIEPRKITSEKGLNPELKRESEPIKNSEFNKESESQKEEFMFDGKKFPQPPSTSDSNTYEEITAMETVRNQSENETAVNKPEDNSSDSEVETEILQPSVITMNKENIVSGKEATPAIEEQQEARIPLKDRLNWLRHVSASISGGINLSQGFINTSESKAGFSAKPIAGIRFAYQINDQVDIESGFLYNYRSGLNSSKTNLTSQDIATNISRYSTSTTTSLHYIDLPVHFTYNYGKHSFAVGMNYSHLINTQNETVATKVENNITSVENSSEQWSKNDGRFASFDLAGIFGYEYSITDRFKICGRINYGLFDVTDDNSFNNSVRDKNQQVRLLLEYRFMKY